MIYIPILINMYSFIVNLLLLLLLILLLCINLVVNGQVKILKTPVADIRWILK